MALVQLLSSASWYLPLVYTVFVLAGALGLYRYTRCQRKSNVPLSVNYHFTRQCNKTCGFCFHTATASFKRTEDEAKSGLRRLEAAGMKKINFAGGEPFLYPRFLGNMIVFCKEQLHLESVSIVTNGSKVRRDFLQRYGQYIDIMAVSCDSFDEHTNIEIGRGSGNQVDQLFRIAEWCQEFGIKFKLNTVVCNLNYKEDMNLTVLLVAGENDFDKTLRNVRKFQITDEQYKEFCRRHQHQPYFVPEPNVLMAKSYLILDEYMWFLNRDGREPSKSILEVEVSEALAQVYWDRDSFVQRGGVYDWSREVTSSRCDMANDERLEW
ncbi:hypothetical protein AJ80_08405 [Polytolypa hystricis UAMH7299]|uniref:Radical SAM core domain-containing protein n=1 Tax=Polytolypa hystricis (strain UAMH7299) TaxID=1447883 RepID=A0A2B7X7R7_POLH7|nr:hypothetical protein AJ80_08405 [Polytolypa hystricis UAMH7299]